MRELLVSLIVFLLTFSVHASELEWSSRLEGNDIVGGSMFIEDGDYALLGGGSFVDARAFSYVRLGLNDLVSMDYDGSASARTVSVGLLITPFNNSGVALSSFTTSVEMEYYSGSSSSIIDGTDYRMNGVHKFSVEVTTIYIDGVLLSGSLANYVYLQAGFYAERYYDLDEVTVPVIGVQMIDYEGVGSIVEASTVATSSATDELYLNWSYVDGAEYYDLEWMWVDNYSDAGLSSSVSLSSMQLTERDFKVNSTRIRTRDQHYRLPQVFSRGYLVYRVRGVGRWLDATDKDLYGAWSSSGGSDISTWDYITVTQEHEGGKNWQYQTTYAEDGKKKEVVQYFDGSLRGRQTVTRINSDDHSVVAETVYDHQGRGVIQILPVPQDKPAIRYYPSLNQTGGVPYSHQNFDWEDTTVASCVAVEADPLNTGAAEYYSVSGYDALTDQDWQQYVPESHGYPFTQVEYTPDNTGRIRNQSGVGLDHRIGSGHETYYYYLQPSQSELDRLFGYKVGYNDHYKKNMVVDANGQVSVSYLDAQGRVIATAMAGDNSTQFTSLESEQNGNHVLSFSDLLNKLNPGSVDTDLDDNTLFSTSRFGAMEDGLEMTSQLGVSDDGTLYDFEYTVTPFVYTESCDQAGVSYPYVYDLTLSVLNDCGLEKLVVTNAEIGTYDIGSTTNDALSTLSNPNTLLDQGSYTVHKSLVVNEEALLGYKAHYLSDLNACLLDSSHFLPELESEPCPTSCEACLEDLGVDLAGFKLLWVIDSLGSNAVVSSLSGSNSYYENIYTQRKEECLAGCTPNFSCDAYYGMLLGDVSPGGQYGGITSGDITVFTDYSWRSDFISGLNDYYDENGNIVLVEAFVTTSYINDISGTPTTELEYQLTDNGSTPELVEPWKLNRSDFLSIFESSWAASLVEYHPEYPLYEYASDICNVQKDIPTVSSGNLPLSSELFDVMVREQITGYGLASVNNYDIDFLASLPGTAPFTVGTTTHPLYAQDPFFLHDYSIHGTSYTFLKKNLMLEALNTDYKGTGMPMISYAILTALDGNNVSSTPSSNVPSSLDWGGVATLSSADQDLVWEKYKFYYMSYKSEINQLLMDFYGFGLSTPIFNGCIGPDALSSGIVEGFSHSAGYYSSIVTELLSLWFPGNVPTTFCGPQYNSKSIRIVRVDALFDPGLSPEQALLSISQDADYAQWEQTGLCPLVADIERLLNEIGVAGELTGSNDQTDFNTFVPDLYEAFSGTSIAGATGPLSNMNISGSINGGGELELSFSGATGMVSASTLTISTPSNSASGSLSWSGYGSSWNIYSIAQSFVTGGANNETKIVITAGSTAATAQEYIASYTIVNASGSFTDCTELQHASNDPDCTKEEQLEAEILSLIQNQINNGLFTTTTTITNDPAFAGSFLSSLLLVPTTYTDDVEYVYVNSTTLAFKTTGGVYNSLSLDMNSSFPTGTFMLIDFEMDVSPDFPHGDITLTFLNQTTGLIQEITGSYTYENSDANIDFSFIDVSCPCEEGSLLSDSELLSLLSTFFNEMISIGTAPLNYQPSSYLALDPYSSFFDLSTLYINAGNPSTPANFSDDHGFTFGGHAVYIVSTDTSTLVSMSNFSYSNGVLQAIAHYSNGNSEVVDVIHNKLISFDEEGITCDDCGPYVQEPLSCTDAYISYTTHMELLYDVANLNTEELSIYSYEHQMDTTTFCGSSYAYITTAYLSYLSNVDLTGIGEPNFLTISEFGSTPFGYSNSLLSPIVILYANAIQSDPSDVSYTTWNDFAANYFDTVSPSICPASLGNPYINIPEMIATPCAQWENNVNSVNAQNQQSIYLEQMGDAFVQAYIEGAMSSVIETFTETHEDKEYHYTLYYYDRAGNLVQTVPPPGVDRFEYIPNAGDPSNPTPTSYNGSTVSASLSDIINYRESNPESIALTATGITGNLAPDHTYETQYRYNSLNQLVWQHTPDGGDSKFAYDALGRLVMSQNAKQKDDHQFSYTLYDELGRIIEVGELTTTPNLLDINEQGRVVYASGGSEFDVNSFNWINQSPATSEVLSREEVTRTIYDELNGVTSPYNSGTLLSPVASTTQIQTLFASYASDNTRNRIVGVIYQENYVSSVDTYESGTFYDYDVHGNVKELLQVHVADVLVNRNQHIKRMEYSYDLVSGNVNEVTYQKDQLDQFIHRYTYDSDNRITITETSKDGVSWEKDAKYFYYEHGPLARTELGEDKVQSLDYAYTIQGWLKTVNGENVDANTMMGQDGKQTTMNSQGGRDAFGFSLSYFDGDYTSAQTQMLDFSPSLNSSATSIYNGNIRAMQTALVDLNENMGAYSAGQGPLKTHQTEYSYDQLNRIKSMDGSFRTVGQLAVSSGYSSTYSFDAYGNLETLTRNAHDGTSSILMDDFTYHYDETINGGYNSQLSWVEDQANASGSYVSEFGDADIDGSMNSGNYKYDEIGQLIKDTDEGITNILWKVTNKVEEVHIDGDGDGAPEKFIHFDYDAMGNRIAKHVTKGADVTSTFYILDAQGNPMSIYSYRTTDGNYRLSERSLYGSSRLGMENVDQVLGFRTLTQTVSQSTYYSYQNITGDKNYELSNHLGNVLEVITDRKLPIEGATGITDFYTADVIAFNDYYPYGMILPESCQEVPVPAMTTVEAVNYTNLVRTNVNSNGDLETNYNDNLNQGWLAGASSTQTVLDGDYIEFEIENIPIGNNNFSVGLSVQDNSTNLYEANYAFFVQSNGNVSIRLGSTGVYNTSRAVGDKFRIERDNGTIRFKKNGVTIYSTTDTQQGTAMYADVSMWFKYGSLNRVYNLVVGKYQAATTQSVCYGNGSAGEYRYGFNGMEADDDIKGTKNSYTTEFRQYDPRIARWLSRDPVVHEMYSPYSAFDNNPIRVSDPSGADGEDETQKENSESSTNNTSTQQNTSQQSISSNGFTVTLVEGGLNVNNEHGIYMRLSIEGENPITRVDFTNFIQVTFDGNLSWEESKKKLELVTGPEAEDQNFTKHNGYVYNKEANTALFLDPGQRGFTTYFPNSAIEKQTEAKMYGTANGGKTFKAFFEDSPSNVKEMNNGYSRVLFTTYISVSTKEKGAQIVAKVYWSYNYNSTTNEWVPNSSSIVPVLIPTTKLSDAASLVLDKVAQSKKSSD